MTVILFVLVIVLAGALLYSHRAHKDALGILRADFDWLEMEFKILRGKSKP